MLSTRAEGAVVVNGVGGGCEGVEGEPWNSSAISAFLGVGFVGAEVVDEDVVGVADNGVTFEDVEASRAGSFEDPDFTLSVLIIGVTVGEDGKGEETSSMEPKVTAEPGTKTKGGRVRRGWMDVP